MHINTDVEIALHICSYKNSISKETWRIVRSLSLWLLRFLPLKSATFPWNIVQLFNMVSSFNVNIENFQTIFQTNTL